jgi:hypothetical protein
MAECGGITAEKDNAEAQRTLSFAESLMMAV